MKAWGIAFVLAFSVCASGQETRPAGASEEPAVHGTNAPKPDVSPALDLTPDAAGKLSDEQVRALIRLAAANYRVNSRMKKDYTYLERDVEHKLDGKGEVKSTETETYEIMQLYGEQVQRLIEKNDKPLDAKEAGREERRFQKLADKRKNESDEDRQKREAEEEKRREKGTEFLKEVADAYQFTLIGSEQLNGRDNWVIDGEPRPDFHPGIKEAEMLSKIRGRLWIDKAELQLSKMDISLLDTISFGWVLARIHGGTRFEYEQTRVNDEVWLPLSYEGKLDARVAVFKSENILAEGSYRDYKKFRTSSKIVSIGEAKPK